MLQNQVSQQQQQQKQQPKKARTWLFRKSIMKRQDPQYPSNEQLKDLALQLAQVLFEKTQNYVFQIEHPSGSYLHFQGYFEMETKMSLNDLTNLFHPTTFQYLAPNRGKPEQAWAYCSKQEGRVLGPWRSRSTQPRDTLNCKPQEWSCQEITDYQNFLKKENF
jgi:hypothetical protein